MRKKIRNPFGEESKRNHIDAQPWKYASIVVFILLVYLIFNLFTC